MIFYFSGQSSSSLSCLECKCLPSLLNALLQEDEKEAEVNTNRISQRKSNLRNMMKKMYVSSQVSLLLSGVFYGNLTVYKVIRKYINDTLFCTKMDGPSSATALNVDCIDELRCRLVKQAMSSSGY